MPLTKRAREGAAGATRRTQIPMAILINNILYVYTCTFRMKVTRLNSLRWRRVSPGATRREIGEIVAERPLNF